MVTLRHEFRQTSARLCHSAGGALEQVHFLLGHASVQTTEKYPGGVNESSLA
jgi:integrase